MLFVSSFWELGVILLPLYCVIHYFCLVFLYFISKWLWYFNNNNENNREWWTNRRYNENCSQVVMIYQVCQFTQKRNILSHNISNAYIKFWFLNDSAALQTPIYVYVEVCCPRKIYWIILPWKLQFYWNIHHNLCKNHFYLLKLSILKFLYFIHLKKIWPQKLANSLNCGGLCTNFPAYSEYNLLCQTSKLFLPTVHQKIRIHL